MSAVTNKEYVEGKLEDARSSEQTLIKQASTHLGGAARNVMNNALDVSAQRIRNDNPELFRSK